MKHKKLLTSLSLSVSCDEQVSYLCDGLKENESLEELTFHGDKSKRPFSIFQKRIKLSKRAFSNLTKVLKEHKKLMKLQFSTLYYADDIFNLQLLFLEKSIGFILIT